MREIVTVESVGRIWILLAVVSPVVGLAVGMAYGVRRRDRGSAWRMGIGIGVVGPANWLLWRLYNGLTDRNGLDTVRNFAINLVVFLLIGLAIGILAGRLQRPAPTDPGPDDPQVDRPQPESAEQPV